MFCNKCGNQVADGAVFCNKCGSQFSGMQAPAKYEGNTFEAQARSLFGQARFTAGNLRPDGVLQSARGAASVALTKTTLIPALIFAGTAIIVGLLISFLLTTTSPAIRDQNAAITVWLISCLGGMSMSFGIDIPSIISATFGASTFFGAAIFLIIPLASLFVARIIRKLFIRSRYPGYTLQTADGIAGAVLFALINMILTLFPYPLEFLIKNNIIYFGLSNADNFLGGIIGQSLTKAVSFNLGPVLLDVFFFSFLIAFFFSMPNIRIFGQNHGLIGLGFATSVQYARRMLFAGFFIALCLFVYVLSKDVGDEIDLDLILMVIPNIIIWLIPILTGGALTFDVKFPKEVAMLMEGGAHPKFSFSGFEYGLGILLIVIGILITVISLYTKFREEANQRLFIQKGITVSLFSAVVIWTFSLLAGFSLNAYLKLSVKTFTAYNGSYKLAMNLSTASMRTFIMTAIIIALSIAIIYYIRRIPAVDNAIMTILSRRGMDLLATALMCVLASFILVKIITGSDFMMSFMSFFELLEVSFDALEGFIESLADLIDSFGLGEVLSVFGEVLSVFGSIF